MTSHSRFPHTGPVDVPTVDADNYAGAVIATEYLLGLGHRRIAHLSGRPDLESARLRERGFRDAMARAGVAVDDRLVCELHGGVPVCSLAANVGDRARTGLDHGDGGDAARLGIEDLGHAKLSAQNALHDILPQFGAESLDVMFAVVM